MQETYGMDLISTEKLNTKILGLNFPLTLSFIFGWWLLAISLFIQKAGWSLKMYLISIDAVNTFFCSTISSMRCNPELNTLGELNTSGSIHNAMVYSLNILTL